MSPMQPAIVALIVLVVAGVNLYGSISTKAALKDCQAKEPDEVHYLLYANIVFVALAAIVLFYILWSRYRNDELGSGIGAAN